MKKPWMINRITEIPFQRSLMLEGSIGVGSSWVGRSVMTVGMIMLAIASGSIVRNKREMVPL